MPIRAALALSAMIALLSPSAGVAQIRVTAEQAAQATARANVSIEASRRTSDILIAYLADPGIAAASSPEALAAAITAIAPTTAAGKAELEDIHRRLVGFAPMAGAGTPSEFAFADRTVSDTATLVRGAIDILDQAGAIPTAVEAGDDAAFQEAYRAFRLAPVLLNRHQAQVMHAQAASAPTGSTAQSKLAAMACASDANVMAQEVAIGETPSAGAIAALDEAETCVRSNVAEGRERLVRSPADPDAQALVSRLRPVESELFDALQDQARWITNVRSGLEAGEAPDSVLGRLQPEFDETLRRVHAQIAETNAIVAQYNQSSDPER